MYETYVILPYSVRQHLNGRHMCESALPKACTRARRHRKAISSCRTVRRGEDPGWRTGCPRPRL